MLYLARAVSGGRTDNDGVSSGARERRAAEGEEAAELELHVDGGAAARLVHLDVIGREVILALELVGVLNDVGPAHVEDLLHGRLLLVVRLVADPDALVAVDAALHAGEDVGVELGEHRAQDAVEALLVVLGDVALTELRRTAADAALLRALLRADALAADGA